MTNKELSQLYWLNREIEKDKIRLAELESAATSTTSKITGLPHAGSVSDKTAIATEIAYLKGVIQNKADRTIIEYNRLMNYINTIDDSLVRQIMTARHIDGLSWKQVAFSIGGGNTADSVWQMHKRFLSKK